MNAGGIDIISYKSYYWQIMLSKYCIVSNGNSELALSLAFPSQYTKLLSAVMDLVYISQAARELVQENRGCYKKSNIPFCKSFDVNVR